MSQEKCTIVVALRDRFSTTESCLDALYQNTPEPFDLIVVLGGAPAKLQNRLRERFGSKAQFICPPQFLNPAQSRNLGLKVAKTRLAVLMDNDVQVRPNWLQPLVECQAETKAVMVVPIILETPRQIHAAGNNLYITSANGKDYGHKVLRYHRMILEEKTNLKRETTDYGEFHCQLVEVEPTLRLGACDEQLLELGECDSALTWAKAGLSMWFEPKSVVFFGLASKVTDPMDIKYFIWRWDMGSMLRTFQYFEKKWNLDLSEHGNFRNFMLNYNLKLGVIPRFIPNGFGLFLERVTAKISEIFVLPFEVIGNRFRRLRARLIGFYTWPQSESNWQSGL